MKRISALAVFVLLVLLSPLAARADAGVGVTTYYRTPGDLTDLPDFDGARIEDFAMGLDLRYNFSLLQLGGLALVTPADPVLLDGYLLGGLVLDLQVLQLSATLGPHVAYNVDANEPDLTLGARVGLDLVLGGVSIGLSYLWDPDFSEGLDRRRPDTGFLGASLLFGW
jgi:hypothetical protein